MTLRKDGRRVSLEGVLTGAALGVLLLYLLEDAGAATAEPFVGGSTGDPGPVDLGSFAAATGRIQVAPLSEVEVDLPAGRPLPSGGRGGMPAGSTGGRGSVGGFPGRPTTGPIGPGPINTLGLTASADSGIPGGGGGGGGGGSGRSAAAITPEQPGEPFSQQEQSGTAFQTLPQIFAVIVRTGGGASSRSLEGMATTSASLRQVGFEDTTLNAASTPNLGLELRSDRIVPVSAVSDLDAADLALISEHVSLLRSTFNLGSGADVLILGSHDLFELATLAATRATASVNTRTAGLDGSSVSTGQGDDLVSLEAIARLTFTGVGTAEEARLHFSLLTEAMRNSQLLLGDGHDRVTINSGFFDGAGELFQAAAEGGFAFFLGQNGLPLSSGSDVAFSLNATAIGLNNSLIDTGAGDDSLSLFTRIDESVAADLLTQGISDPSLSFTRIGLLNSELRMGEGNDLVRINGSVVDSLIDLGPGVNQLIIEGPLLGNSRVLMGEGGGGAIFRQGLGGLVRGGPGDEVFTLGSLSLAGEVDGGGGDDTLSASGSVLGARDLLLVNKPNAGNLAGTRFRDIGTISLGRGDDVVVMDLNGTLTGRLLGGEGLDRLEFTNWSLPVQVDLDLGSSTAIMAGRPGGLLGIEQVVGGLGNDLLVSSGAFAGIDGADGDDTLYLRWSPWLSPADAGLQLRGGAGRDLFVISGLDQPLPQGWDRVSGLPVLTDLDLSSAGPTGIGLTDRIAWERQVLQPSGVEGLGNARLLPIAPLEQLLGGMTDDTRQLAIASDGLSSGGGVLHLLGSNGQGTSQPVALISSALGTAEPVSQS